MLIALLVAAAAPVHPVDVVGFSPDNKYVAWIEHGVGETNGFPWARLHVTDVAQSADAVPTAQISFDNGDPQDTEQKAVKQARAAAEGWRRRLHVASWVAPRRIRHDDQGELLDAKNKPFATVDLKVNPGPATCQAPYRSLLLEVLVRRNDDTEPTRLAGDSAPPRDRSCMVACVLADVYAHGKATLVFAACGVDAFQGRPVTRYSAYAGVLPYSLEPRKKAR
jgi:predicted secreted protein DUF2259